MHNTLANNVFLTRRRLSAGTDAYALTLAGRDVVELADAGGHATAALGLRLWCRIERVGDYPHQWTVRTRKYLYHLEDPTEESIQFVAYHWHPEVPGIEFPHIHPLVAEGEYRRFHYATPHTTLKDILTFAMRDLDVVPRRDDWREALDAAESMLRSTLS